MPEPAQVHLVTGVIHIGHAVDPTTGAVTPPLITSTTFARNSEGQIEPGRDIYTRTSNPNRRNLEKQLAWLEGGTEALAFSSGQAAAYAVFQSLEVGAHVILPKDLYYNIKLLLDQVLGRWGLTYTQVDMTDIQATQAAFQSNTRLVWIETPSNPQLRITPIQATADLAHQHGAWVVCDNTWSTPYGCQPLALGADLVLHSTTKYLGGHSDILGGVLIAGEKTNEAWWQQIRIIQTLGGGVPAPFDCWLLQRSLATFPLRMQAHCQNAEVLAAYLAQHPAIEAVFYPGLPEHPGHEIAKQEMKHGFGGMMSVLIRGNQTEAIQVAQRLQLFTHATSLGGVESLVEHRKSVEGVHSVSPENLLRISVGIEYSQDLLADWEQALEPLVNKF